jgi:hypothetical protein
MVFQRRPEYRRWRAGEQAGDDSRDGGNGAAKESKAMNGRRDEKNLKENRERAQRTRPRWLNGESSVFFLSIHVSTDGRGIIGRIGELTILQQGT